LVGRIEQGRATLAPGSDELILLDQFREVREQAVGDVALVGIRLSKANFTSSRDRRILRPGAQSGAGQQGEGGSVSSASQGWPGESATPMAISVSRCYGT